jgi:tetratricopeptide (TPR) repeat protein
MSKQYLPRLSRLLWFVVILLVFVALSWRALISSFAGNVGLLILSRSLAHTDQMQHSLQDNPDLRRAQKWLQVATSLDTNNRGALRGTGFAFGGQGQEERAMTAWTAARLSSSDFITFGDQFRAQGQLQEALTWYSRAAQAERGSAMPWYYMGLAHEGLQQWNEALAAFQQGLQRRDSAAAAGSLNLEIGSILQEHIRPADLTAALNYYEASLRSNQFIHGWERVNAHYFRGDALRQQNRLPEALQEFSWVVEAAPDHYWGNMWLGLLTWQVNGNAQEAEQSLKAAATLRPDVKWSYRWLADLYRQVGRLADAAEAYRQVLNLDPQDQAARQFLSEYFKNDH